MASFNLKAKVVDRTALFYNKFEYRAVIKSPHMFYSWNCKNIDDYRAKIKEIVDEYEANDGNDKWFSWRRPKPEVSIEEYELIDSLLRLEQKYTKKVLTFRRENQSCTVYTSNVNIVKEILAFAPDAQLSQVSLMPTGVLTFKKDPPAKYRAYMSNRPMPVDFKESMLEYLSRTPDISPSNAFYTYLHRGNKFAYQSYLWDKYYVDYNDDKNLMMMMLMFPGMIGKKYKLEKK